MLARLYYHFINPQGLTSKNAEANVIIGLPTCNQKKPGTASWILRESNKAITTSTYHSPQHLNSLYLITS